MKISLKSARVNANLTQREVAEKLQVSATTVYSWEKGLFKVTYIAKMVLSEVYGIPIENIDFERY